MQFDHFLERLEAFHNEFDIDVSPAGRKGKLVEEMCEFLEADDGCSPASHADDESIDVLVCAIANCKARGITDMLHVAGLKLERTAEKYRAEKHGATNG